MRAIVWARAAQVVVTLLVVMALVVLAGLHLDRLCPGFGGGVTVHGDCLVAPTERLELNVPAWSPDRSGLSLAGLGRWSPTC